MAWRDWGNQPVYSTTAQPVTNPSTATLVAEVDSTQLGSNGWGTAHKVGQVTWLIGADTNATWQLEVAQSTTLTAGPSTSVDVAFVKTPTAQTGQYVTVHRMGPNTRVRARVNSTFTGAATATILVEMLS